MAEGSRHEIARRLQWLHFELRGVSVPDLLKLHRKKLGEYWEQVQAARASFDVGPGYIGPLATGMSPEEMMEFAATEKQVLAAPSIGLARRLARE